MLSLTRYICEVADEGTAEAPLGLRVWGATELCRRSHITEAASAASKVRGLRGRSATAATAYEIGRCGSSLSRSIGGTGGTAGAVHGGLSIGGEMAAVGMTESETEGLRRLGSRRGSSAKGVGSLGFGTGVVASASGEDGGL